jgi:hypothetical protein
MERWDATLRCKLGYVVSFCFLIGRVILKGAFNTYLACQKRTPEVMPLL